MSEHKENMVRLKCIFTAYGFHLLFLLYILASFYNSVQLNDKHVKNSIIYIICCSLLVVKEQYEIRSA